MNKLILAFTLLTMPFQAFCDDEVFKKVHDLYLFAERDIRAEKVDTNTYWFVLGQLMAYDTCLFIICNEDKEN